MSDAVMTAVLESKRDWIPLSLLLLVFASSSALGQGFRDGIADSWLEEAAPADNHGSDKELPVKNNPTDNFRAVFKLDFSGVPANANVTGAEVWIWVTGEDDSGLPVNIYRVTDDWNEGTVTWTNTGNDYDATTIHGSFVPDSTGWVKIDIAPLVQSWICGEFEDYGLMLIPTSSDIESTYASREFKTKGQRPRIKFTASGTNPCSDGVDHFVIIHDNFGLYCLAETITVRAVDAANNPVTGYAEEISLDSQSGRGTWTLITGNGTLTDATANDGLATYQWDGADSEAVFALSYPEGAASIDVDVYQTDDTTLRDDDTEGALAFSANGFTVTAAALSNPPPALITPFAATQVAAIDFPVHIAAYGQTPADPQCGVIESYTGNKALKFWSTYVDPGSGGLSMAVDGTAVATAEGGAAAQAVVFTNGQATVTGRYDDVGLMQLLVKDDTTINADLPAGIRGATSNFVVQPADFVISNIRAGATVNPQAADASGPVFIAAGADFEITVTAVDAEGDATPNYGQESSPEGVRFDVNLIAPAGGAAPPVSAAVGFGPFAGGGATGFDFVWPEVGIMELVPGIGDGDYLGSGDRTGSPSERVGRFIPDHFAAAANAPMFQTACVAGGYSYLGQGFDYLVPPVITLTAEAVGNTPTLNYTGDFFKLATAFMLNRLYQAATGTLDVTDLPLPAVDPVVAPLAAGTGTVTFSSGTGLKFARSIPVDPFAADIDLSIDVLDADGVAAVGTTVTFADISFSAGATMRYGRIAFNNAVGSERINLPVPMAAQYFAGSGIGFVTNVDDSCSMDVTLSFAGFTQNLVAGETCVLDSGAPGDSNEGCAAPAPLAARFNEPPVAGDFNLNLQAPGAGNNGSVIIQALVPTWLTFDWDTASPGEENPTGQATFGIFQGNSQQIYLREVY